MRRAKLALKRGLCGGWSRYASGACPIETLFWSTLRNPDKNLSLCVCCVAGVAVTSAGVNPSVCVTWPPVTIWPWRRTEGSFCRTARDRTPRLQRSASEHLRSETSLNDLEIMCHDNECLWFRPYRVHLLLYFCYVEQIWINLNKTFIWISC